MHVVEKVQNFCELKQYSEGVPGSDLCLKSDFLQRGLWWLSPQFAYKPLPDRCPPLIFITDIPWQNKQHGCSDSPQCEFTDVSHGFNPAV